MKALFINLDSLKKISCFFFVELFFPPTMFFFVTVLFLSNYALGQQGSFEVNHNGANYRIEVKVLDDNSYQIKYNNKKSKFQNFSEENFAAAVKEIWPSPKSARLQLLHNAPDPFLQKVDVLLDSIKILDDFEFRHATPYIDIPAGVQLEMEITTENNDSVKKIKFTPNPENSYVAVITGVVDKDNLQNSSGKDIDISARIIAGRERNTVNNAVMLLPFHSAPDAGSYSIETQTGEIIVKDDTYNDVNDYITLTPNPYTFNVKINNNSIGFNADLSASDGQAAVLFTSGFMNTAGIQNRKPFNLFLAFADGVVRRLPDSSNPTTLQIFPASPPSMTLLNSNLQNVRQGDLTKVAKKWFEKINNNKIRTDVENELEIAKKKENIGSISFRHKDQKAPLLISKDQLNDLKRKSGVSIQNISDTYEYLTPENLNSPVEVPEQNYYLLERV